MRLMRTILERLECSFARQEAKLDQLLLSLRSQSLPQQPLEPQQVSTPDVGTRQSSVEYSFMASAYSRPRLSDHSISSVLPATPLFPEVDRFLEDVYRMDREMPGMTKRAFELTFSLQSVIFSKIDRPYFNLSSEA